MISVDIEKRVGGFRLRVAFEAEAGVTGILGASGCGKSMTLRCIAGIDKPDWGRIVLDDVVLFDSERGINLPPQRRGVGYLFQSYALFPHMTVEQNIRCGLRWKRDPEQRERAFAEIVERMQLDGLERHKPHQLSGGQAQRVALARMLVNRPRLLLLDEPFSALDSHLRDSLQIELGRLLGSYGGAVLLVTHSRDEAYRLCDRIALMEGGGFLALGPTKALFADPGSVAGARMTGCKNIVRACKTGEYEVEVPDWGVRFTTGKPVGEGLRAVGIRAHYFGPDIPHNRQAVRKTDEMEEPFAWIIRFRYERQRPDTPDVWWRLPKDRRPGELPGELGVDPADVLLLYDPAVPGAYGEG